MRNYNLSYNIIFSLIIILPLSLITGPFLSDLSISLSALVFLVTSLFYKKNNILFHPLIIIFNIWCIYLIFLSIFSDNMLLSFESSLFFFRFGFFSLSIFFILSSNYKVLKYFFLLSFALIIIIFFDSIFQIYTGSNIIGFEYSQYRLSSFFGDELILGSYISRIAIINFIICFIFFKSNKNYKLIFYISFVISFIITLYTGERVALFYLFCLFLFFLIFIRGETFYKYLSILILFSISFLILITNNSIKTRIIDHTLSPNQFNISGEGRIKVFSYVHEQHYKSALTMFMDNKLLGVGPKLFREYCLKDNYYFDHGCTTHPHNYYIQLLAETGVIGLLPVIILYLVVLSYLLYSIYLIILNKYTDYVEKKLTSIMPILLLLFPFVPTANIFNNWVSIFTFLCIGIMLHHNIKNKII